MSSQITQHAPPCPLFQSQTQTLAFTLLHTHFPAAKCHKSIVLDKQLSNKEEAMGENYDLGKLAYWPISSQAEKPKEDPLLSKSLFHVVMGRHL